MRVRLAFVIIMLIAAVSGQFETISSSDDASSGPQGRVKPRNKALTNNSNKLSEADVSMDSTTGSEAKPDMNTDFSGLTPTQAISKVAQTQNTLVKTTASLNDKVNDLPLKMMENFEKTMAELDKLNDKFGALGSLVQFMSKYGFLVAAFLIALPATLICLQVMILWQSCKRSRSYGSYGGGNEMVDLDAL